MMNENTVAPPSHAMIKGYMVTAMEHAGMCPYLIKQAMEALGECLGTMTADEAYTAYMKSDY